MGIHTIENRENYSIIHLVGELLDIEETKVLKITIDEITADQERSIIIGLKNVENISLEFCAFFESIHHELYEKGISIVFAEPNENVHKKLKQEQLHLVVNITPTIIEACDIINMEILERDILNEE